MRFWSKRKKLVKSHSAGLSMEKLEDRAMMAVVPLISGQTTTFHDADGTQVKVKLAGPGQGSMELVGGVLTGAAIDNIVLNGTSGASKLKITTSGGSVAGTTINELVISKALNELSALKNFKAKSVDFVDGGQFLADGSLQDIHFRNLGAGAAINVTGSVRHFKAGTLATNSSIEVTETLQKFFVEFLATGAEYSANQLDHLKVTKDANGASVEIGDGGLAKATFKNISNTAISSDGDIGHVIVKGDALGAAFASNIDKGSDGAFGTIDDFVTDFAAAGYINKLNFKGSIGAAGSADEVNVVTSGSVGQVKLSRSAKNANTEPVVWTEAAQQSIPLSILQAAANATGVPDDQVWIAVFGQEIATPASGQAPVTSAFDTYYLDPTQLNGLSPKLTSTKSVAQSVSSSTPNQPILPSFTIQDWKNAAQTWGSNLAFPSPSLNSEWSGRIVISIGAPVQAQVSTIDGSVSSPSASDLADPSTGTFYDFLEFTVTNPNTSGSTLPLALDIDTTQVDSFGLPMQLQLFQPQAAGQNYQLPFTGVTVSGNSTITGIADTTGLAAGQPVFGAGIPGGALIQSVNSGAGSITLNVNASQPSGSASLVAYTAPQFVTSFTGTTTLGSTTITNIPDTTGLGTGQPVFGAGIPAGATIQSIVNSTPTANPPVLGSITLNLPATASATAVPLTAFSGGPVGVQALRDDITLATSNAGLLQFLIGQIGANNTQAQAFLQTAAAYPKSPATAITGTTGSGVPITISTASVANVVAGDVVVISGVLGNTAANGTFTVASVDTNANTFTLTGSTGSGTYTSGGTWTTYTSSGRLVSPKDVVEAVSSPQDTSALNNYYNEVVDALFLQYLPSAQTVNGVPGGGQTLQLASAAFNGTSITYNGVVTNTGTVNGNYAIQFTDPTNTDTNTYNVYYPWFAGTSSTTSNAPDGSVYTPLFGLAAPPQWIIDSGWITQSASQMIFACDAVFADNTVRNSTSYDMNAASAPVLGDLENSISAAFNRGIVLSPANTWGDTTTWFRQNTSQSITAGIDPGTYNYWVEYWHSAGLMLSDLAYAFPYDDKFVQHQSELIERRPRADHVGKLVVVVHCLDHGFPKLPHLSNTRRQCHAHRQRRRQLAERICRVLHQWNCHQFGRCRRRPADPTCTRSRRCRDANSRLAIAARWFGPTLVHRHRRLFGRRQQLAQRRLKPLLVEENMQIQSRRSGRARPWAVRSILTAILPGSTFSGTLQYSISLTDGTGVQNLGPAIAVSSSTPSTNVTIPANLLAFTGDITTDTSVNPNTSTIQNVSNFLDIEVGQLLSSPNLQTGTTITDYQTASLILSNNPTATDR